jgi:hypothetical protein
MSKWKAELDLSEEWSQADDEEITIYQLATTVADRLEQLSVPGLSVRGHNERRDLVHGFREFAADGTESADDFDEIFAELYEWADENRVWVSTH